MKEVLKRNLIALAWGIAAAWFAHSLLVSIGVEDGFLPGWFACTAFYRSLNRSAIPHAQHVVGVER